ncbi:MAG TPA: hypothetical protein VLI93_03025 [Acetobacteraceae bacterium]|nr:hypothetical protein [Acetobacteraceae bacterium]
MDEELKRYLDAMMAKINDGHEAILNRITSLERDFQNTKEFLVGDALVASRRWLDLEARVTKLERPNNGK